MTPETTSLQLVFEDGVDELGNPIFYSRRFNNINVEASDDDIQTIASALASLSADALSGATRRNDYSLLPVESD
ncbi:DUF1659 domain-containing protein [Natribacillus halophilus]|uniref:DUF1659 domain-containing protein n=1 Tax=Natribacillus halophilus TaxID=549003 RepID=A0A1G8R1K6_9BACI|nr:DUF1659 domain-containing protein [Natribacillus halophilus]SDJ10864.1 Protein of unknown function [Natribacillus halophilus]